MFYKKIFFKKLGLSFVIFFGVLILHTSSLAGELISVCSNKNNIKAKSLAKFVSDITGKGNPKLCVVGSSQNDLNLFNNAKKTNKSELNSADLIFVKDLQKNINISNKKIVALDCKSLKYCSNCLGVFYFKNGRTMLVIFEEELKKLNLKLPSKYNNYIDSRQFLNCN